MVEMKIVQLYGGCPPWQYTQSIPPRTAAPQIPPGLRFGPSLQNNQQTELKKNLSSPRRNGRAATAGSQTPSTNSNVNQVKEHALAKMALPSAAARFSRDLARISSDGVDRAFGRSRGEFNKEGTPSSPGGGGPAQRLNQI